MSRKQRQTVGTKRWCKAWDTFDDLKDQMDALEAENIKLWDQAQAFKKQLEAEIQWHRKMAMCTTRYIAERYEERIKLIDNTISKFHPKHKETLCSSIEAM